MVLHLWQDVLTLIFLVKKKHYMICICFDIAFSWISRIIHWIKSKNFVNDGNYLFLSRLGRKLTRAVHNDPEWEEEGQKEMNFVILTERLPYKKLHKLRWHETPLAILTMIKRLTKSYYNHVLRFSESATIAPNMRS